MKKQPLLLFVLFWLCASSANAQDYKTAVGLKIDFGGGTLVGPCLKKKLGGKSFFEAEALFHSIAGFVSALYEYQMSLPNAKNLAWYLGIGPAVAFPLDSRSSGIEVYARPVIGMEYKITSAPLTLSLDWRPYIYVGDKNGKRVFPSRIGIGIKYIVK